jgi:signal transduction histidine kinase
MPVAALPSQGQLLALAHAALLTQLDRDDPDHALAALLADLGTACGRRAWLDGVPCSHPGHADDGALTLPVHRLGTALGRLCLDPGADLAPAPAAAALHAVTDTLAALLQRSHSRPQDPAGSELASGGALVRAALRGAGTFVWDWHIASDRLGDIDQGFVQLGYAPAPGRRTQQDWDSLIHPDDRGANHQAYLRHAAGEVDDYEHTYRARAADGSWRWLQERGRIVEWAAQGTPLRMVGVQADITGRRLAESAATAATQRLGKIAAHVPGALFQFQRADDGSGCFPYISERSVALFGLHPDELAADASRLLRRVDLAQRASVMASIDASGVSLLPWVQEFQVHRPDGAVRWIRASATPQREPDGQVLWHGYFEDLTEWQALTRADHRQRMAEAANLAKNEFLSRMSHELRTPLNAVLGFAQLMGLDEAAPLAAVQQRRLALICQSGEHLLAMIDDLLDLTSIEAGRLPLAPQAIDLRPLADDALAMVQAAAARHDLALVCEGADVQVWADRTRLRQVLINLLSNAIKYNRPGGRVLVRVLEAGGQAVLQVHDTGLGLSAEDRAHLFEPFNRLGQARGPVEGTGIGLSITHHLVRLMGGQITVHSTPGKGSCFAVHLPMPAALHPAGPAA